MQPNILAGFSLDCNALFVKFEKLSTVRYASFAEVWKEMKFSLVFNGRRSKEVSCFTSEALLYVKHSFIQSNSFLRKICSLYLMYGLYYKQPLRNSSKILVTLDDWLYIQEFLLILKENCHFDTLFILLKLILDNAFEFSVVNSIKYTAIPCKGIIHPDLPDMKEFEKLDLNSLTKNLEKIECNYSNIKKKLSETLQILPINYANDSFSKKLKQIYESSTFDNSKPGPSEQSQNISEKRALIRKKSFAKKSKMKYSHNFKSDDVSDSDI